MGYAVLGESRRKDGMVPIKTFHARRVAKRIDEKIEKKGTVLLLLLFVFLRLIYTSSYSRMVSIHYIIYLRDDPALAAAAEPHLFRHLHIVYLYVL